MDLKTAITETKEYLELNYDDEGDGFSDDGAYERLEERCGRQNDGCSMAGSEYCDFECPFSYI